MATALRVTASTALAWPAVAALPEHGATAAGLALGAAAFLEAALLAPAARRACRVGRPAALLGRHGTLTAPWLLNNLPALVTTVGIAHAAEADDSLVVWPVTYALAAVFSSGLADWDTISSSCPDRVAVRRVTGWLAAGFGALFTTVVLSTMDTLFVTGLNAVPGGPAALGLTWLPVLLPMPVLWVLRGTARGVLMAATRPAGLVVGSTAHLLVHAGVVTVLGLTSLSGVAVAGVAVIAGLAVELAVLAASGHRDD